MGICKTNQLKNSGQSVRRVEVVIHGGIKFFFIGRKLRNQLFFFLCQLLCAGICQEMIQVAHGVLNTLQRVSEV